MAVRADFDLECYGCYSSNNMAHMEVATWNSCLDCLQEVEMDKTR
jgi:hypothetical protein